MILRPSEWPLVCLIWRNYIRGIYVGGCVGSKTPIFAVAHAHTSDDEWHGWICVHGIKRLGYNELMLHEIAHLIADTDHTPKWQETVLKIGGTLDTVYDVNGKLLIDSY